MRKYQVIINGVLSSEIMAMLNHRIINALRIISLAFVINSGWIPAKKMGEFHLWNDTLTSTALQAAGVTVFMQW